MSLPRIQHSPKTEQLSRQVEHHYKSPKETPRDRDDERRYDNPIGPTNKTNPLYPSRHNSQQPPRPTSHHDDPYSRSRPTSHNNVNRNPTGGLRRMDY
ncbi:hypothetical protein Pmani_014614 [Petrolisthes manimaculis]|nr:hypothetical protein Pmani_014614 [Petrolisthes manimaculis]